MIKIMFVCHGNICRSPMAEIIFKDMAQKSELGDRLEIFSSATSNEEISNGIGNPIYSPARAELEKHGYFCGNKRAVQLCADDYGKYDMFIGMDSFNIQNMMRIFGGDPERKIHKMMDYSERSGDVSDPWFTGKFDIAFADIYEGCEGLLNTIIQNGNGGSK